MKKEDIELLKEFTVEEWCNNCGISTGKRTFYYDIYLNAETANGKDFSRAQKDLSKLIDLKDPSCTDYDICIMDKDSYKNIFQIEEEYLKSKDIYKIFVEAYELLIKELD